MGFSEQQVHEALEKSGLVVDQAIDLLVGATDRASQGCLVLPPSQTERLVRDIDRSPVAREQIRRFGLLSIDVRSQNQTQVASWPAADIDAYVRESRGKSLEQFMAEADARDRPDPRPPREIVLERMWERLSLTLTEREKQFIESLSQLVPFVFAMQALIIADRDIKRCVELVNQLRSG
jgi:hypothetical protein